MGLTTIDATSIPPDSRLNSPASLAFFVGNPPQQMQIFTGTVAIHRKSHRKVEHETIRVVLGSTTSHAQACSKVDLASITNSDSEFIFAVDTNTVEIDASTGLITLVTDIGVQGTDSIFERFSYHVEVLSDPVDTLIAGTIRWSESLGAPSPSALAGLPLFRVDAGVFTTPPGGTPHMQVARSGFSHGNPVLAGGSWAVAYQIDNVPLGPSNVVRPVLLPNELTNLPAGTTVNFFYFAPPTTIQLTLAAPSAVGVDFEMLLDAGPR
ncbi:MAG TPA: hypothetical protein VGO77_11025 [Mycobacterium sp.]|jgi:hypothetical protein|nr:hypothetical protein [Mycobacterium sp.]